MAETAPLSPPFATLYSDHHRWLQGWLRRKLGCAEQAADLTQDTFLKVLARAEDIPGLRSPRAFLTTVARGLLVDFFRRAELERAYLADLALLPEPLQPSPEEREIVIETLQALDALLDGLSPRARAAWLYSRLDGLTHAEIAGRLGVSVSRVRQYLAGAARHCYTLRFGEGT